jgi:hypothetical protein
MAKTPDNLFEAARPIDESKADPAFVQMLVEAAAEPVGRAMTKEEFLRHLACLAQR